jgi:hypothetical protein
LPGRLAGDGVPEASGALRKVFAQVEGDEGLAVEFLRGEQADAVEVAELLRINEVKHRDVPIVPLPQFVGYLRRLLAQPDVFVLSYRDVETRRLLGATTVYDIHSGPWARSWSAVEVEDGGRPDLYFHMYGELVRWRSPRANAAWCWARR